MDLEQGDILWVGKGRAMKDFEKFFEDMPSDSLSAVIGWTKWFQAAKESEIPALVRFAVQKEKRLPSLAAHAIYSVSTGKLEGFNNKIKVAKRIGYGYRDDDFFLPWSAIYFFCPFTIPQKIVMNRLFCIVI